MTRVQGNDRSQDPAALDARTRLNQTRGSLDLATWLYERAGIGEDARLLDVGCGTGQVMLRYGAAALRHGRCVALDVSEESLRVLRQAAKGPAYARLETACIDMDTLAQAGVHTELCGFTHIVSAYALYYSADAVRLLQGLVRRLDPAGSLLVVAPAPGNNAEWFSLLEAAGARVPDRIHAVEEFLERIVVPFALRNFESVQIELATNTVQFDSPEEVETYWRSNIYFDTTATPRVRARAEEMFKMRGGFVNHKRFGLVAMRNRMAP